MTHRFSDKSTPFQASPSEGRRLRAAHEAIGFGREVEQSGALGRVASQGSHYNPNQPRVPAGNPDGGQWTQVAGAGRDDPRVVSDATPENDWKPGARYANSRRPGYVSIRIGERLLEVEAGQAARLVAAQARARDATDRARALDPNWRPVTSESRSVEGLIRGYEAEARQAEARIRELTGFSTSLTIPRQRPASAQERHDIVREIARWLAKHRREIIEGVAWLLEYEDSIEAYLDPPRTLDELQRAAAKPKRGYDIHHIVERTSAEQDGYPRSMIDAPENLVRIPRFKHWEITAWYMTKNENYEGLSPREYLRGKDWIVRTSIGLRALLRHGVLKP